MAIINFTVFIDKIKSGIKRQTIRKTRVNPIKLGTKLQLYTGFGTKERVKIGDAVCIATQKIIIVEMTFAHKERWRIYVDAILLSKSESKQLAIDDGFDSIDSFCLFFKEQYGLPFNGVVIKWGELKQ